MWAVINSDIDIVGLFCYLDTVRCELSTVRPMRGVA